MAKGNMFLGKARGSVGDVTLQVLKGQQVAKSRNRQPANPRTKSQMFQRSRFMSAVKFFTRGRQNYFQFAFEGKSGLESDFNAFMRHNAKAGVCLTKDKFDDQKVLALGKFMVTQGSLTSVPVVMTENYLAVTFTDVVPTTYANTIGGASKFLVDRGYAQIGDIVTVLNISGNVFPNTVLEEYDEVSMPTWRIAQFTVDPASTDKMPGFLRMTSENNTHYLCLCDDEGQAAAISISRKVNGKLLVSDSILALDDQWQYAYDKCTTEEYVGKVLADWQSREPAILEGSLSANK